MKSARKKVDAFTLMELLVVMGIMAVLLLSAGPMWNGLTKSAGIKGATMQFRQTLALARQWAITHRQTTYVIIPVSDSNMQYRAYSVYALTGTTNSGGGELVREWDGFAQGIRFSDGGSDNVLSSTAPKLITNDVGSVKGPMKGFVFKPDGTMTGISDISKKPSIAITEGIRDDATGVFTAKPNAYTNFIQISSMAGQVKVTEQ